MHHFVNELNDQQSINAWINLEFMIIFVTASRALFKKKSKFLLIC